MVRAARKSTATRRRRTPSSWWRTAGRVVAGTIAAGFTFLAYVYLTLPDVRPLATMPPDDTAFMRMRDRQAHAKGTPAARDYRWVPYTRISPNLRRAVLVAEDDLFWDHEGIDIDALRESLQQNLSKGEVVRGGSTITQQLAKNLYLSPSRDPIRKLRELMITRLLERQLTKQRILELYLNVVEWGDGVWGAEAASRRYFRKPASQLTASEAALLAGSLINPIRYSPASPPARLRSRQAMILRRMGRAPADVAPAPAVAPVPLPSPGTTPADTGAPTSPQSPPASDEEVLRLDERPSATGSR
jgi:monofunctional glycosyltransferase